MIFLPGKISDKLLAKYGENVADWPAYRAPDEIKNMPNEYYKGIRLGNRWKYFD